jgi:hypothetical protein
MNKFPKQRDGFCPWTLMIQIYFAQTYVPSAQTGSNILHFMMLAAFYTYICTGIILSSIWIQIWDFIWKDWRIAFLETNVFINTINVECMYTLAKKREKNTEILWSWHSYQGSMLWS